MIECACGCGTLIEPEDSRGRSRRFKPGHATRVRKYPEGFFDYLKGNTWGFKKGGQPWNKGYGDYIKGELNPFYGKRHTDEMKAHLGIAFSKAMKGRMPKNIDLVKELAKPMRYKKGQFAKEKHPNWKGGITPVNHLLRTSGEYKEWRASVFVRDNYTCTKCKKRGGDLIADHIRAWYKYPELRFDVSNGRTLCEVCNYESTHVLKEWLSS